MKTKKVKAKIQKTDTKYITAMFVDGSCEYFNGDGLWITEKESSFVILDKEDNTIAHVLKWNLRTIYFYTPNLVKK